MNRLERSLRSAAALARAANVMFERPDRLPRAALAMAKWGPTFVGLAAAAAARYPERNAIVDDVGPVTYAQLWARTNAIATGLAGRGIGGGSTVGVVCTNHRGFVEAMLGVAKVGADIVFVNTGFGADTLAEVVAGERIDALVHDAEFAGIVSAAGVGMSIPETELAAMARDGSPHDRPKVEPGRFVILTSGTTGRPKGAARVGGAQAGGLDAATGLLERIPLRTGDRTLIAAPLFHAWGLGNLGFAMSLSATIHLARRFDPEIAMRTIQSEQVTALVVVPVMLRRLIGVGGATTSLRLIASSGSAIGSPLVTEVLDRFGPILYNVYGSTEVAIATIATPDDLRTEPTTAGRATLGTTVRIFAVGDGSGDGMRPAPVTTGTTGRVFVGNRIGFSGYTDGATKASIDGLIATGDVGHLDGEGRLFIDGREDDMIISGGENVYPREVEDLLVDHPDVIEAAVVGTPDDEFGQRLVAYIVKSPQATVNATTIKAFVRDRLARHKVPREVFFIAELPRNATGKVLRRELRPPTRARPTPNAPPA